MSIAGDINTRATQGDGPNTRGRSFCVGKQNKTHKRMVQDH